MYCCRCRTSPLPKRNLGWKAEMRRSLLWVNWQDRSLDRYIQELIVWAHILCLLTSREALKSFMVKIVSCDQKKLQETSWIFLQKNICLLAWTPLYKYNHIYTLLSLLPLRSSLSELCEMLSLWLQSSYLPQIKLNS